MAEFFVLTLRLDHKLKKQLDRLSRAMSRSRSFVAAEAILRVCCPERLADRGNQEGHSAS